MIEGRINLYSDTQTRPTKEMRQAMLNAPVGDEQKGLDESVNRLCRNVAKLLGMDAAVFLPSGTMCNEIAILVHCRPGDEVYAHQSAHLLNFEAGLKQTLYFSKSPIQTPLRMRLFPRWRKKVSI